MIDTNLIKSNSKDISEILIEDGIDGIITDFPNLITK